LAPKTDGLRLWVRNPNVRTLPVGNPSTRRLTHSCSLIHKYVLQVALDKRMPNDKIIVNTIKKEKKSILMLQDSLIDHSIGSQVTHTPWTDSRRRRSLWYPSTPLSPSPLPSEDQLPCWGGERSGAYPCQSVQTSDGRRTLRASPGSTLLLLLLFVLPSHTVSHCLILSPVNS